MNEDQLQAFEAVDRINDQLYKKYNKKNNLDKLPVVSITFAGVYMFINLSIPHTDVCEIPEINIYNSENNDRIYYEDSNKYESYYKFIKRKFIEIKEEINKIKL